MQKIYINFYSPIHFETGFLDYSCVNLVYCKKSSFLVKEYYADIILNQKRRYTLMYDVILALDWSKSNMAIARLDKESDKPKAFQRASDIEFLKKYLLGIKKSKSITIEESGSAHYLFLELVDFVDEVIVVDPFRNKLLLDGPKNDIKDAEKLALLTRNKTLMRQVYHSFSENYEIRKLVSAYEDVVKGSVRAQNQLESIKISNASKLKPADEFVMAQKKLEISFFKDARKIYEDKFNELHKQHPDIKRLAKIDGIGIKSAVKIIGVVLEANRFPNHRKFLAYCGLVKYRKQSGNRDYGERITRFSRVLKSVFKMAALTAISNETAYKNYYEYLINTKKVYTHNARNCIARLIAKTTLTILKKGVKYNPALIQKKIA
jgi:transposase